MPTSLIGYRVFIASPGGLDACRQVFRRVLQEYNRTDAFRRGLAFIPVGWETMSPTRGRAQSVINDNLKQCDYFILVLHDRWGSPPAGDDEFTSGTEEEFAVASQCLNDTAYPMDDIAVFFKTVPQRQMSDPGKQLTQVIAFKEKLEAEHTLLFGTFEADEEFAEALRGSLANWVWKHENPPQEALVGASETTRIEGELALDNDAEKPSDAIEYAAQLAAAGKLTQAETILAKAAASGENPAADVAYAELLARARRRRQAEESFDRGIAVAKTIGDQATEGRGLLGLGRLLESKVATRRPEAIVALQRATGLFEQLGMRGELAETWMALGASQRNSGRFEDALDAYEKARAALIGLARSDLEAALHLGRGEVYRDLNRLTDAKADFEFAIELKIRDGLEDEIPDAYAGLGAVFEALGDAQGAETQYQRSLDLFATRRNWIGIADVADHLGHISEGLGKLNNAMEAFERSAEAFDILQNLEAAADAYLSLGRLSGRLGDREAARRHYQDALDLVSRMHKSPLTSDMSAQILDGIEALKLADDTAVAG